MKWRLWSEEEKGALRELLAKGFSGDQIAKQMNERFGLPYTRSAISGAKSRLGLKQAANFGSPRIKKAPKPLQLQRQEATKLSNCTIWELTQNRCRYPMWPDPYRADSSYLYCGARTNEPPYCQHHSQIAFRQSNRDPSASFSTVKVPAKPLKLTTW